MVIAMFLQTLRLARAADEIMVDTELQAGVSYDAVSERMSPSEFHDLVMRSRDASPTLN